MKIIKLPKIVEFLRENEGNNFEADGTVFSYEINPANILVPKSVVLRSDDWSESTNRSVSGDRLVEFLTLFNYEPEKDWRDYKNDKGRGSTATTAKYVVSILSQASGG